MSIRIDEETERELAALTVDGRSRSAAVLDAIHQVYRQSAYEQMRRDAEALRAEAGYQAEAAAIAKEMGAEDAW